jgi:hypothetical protein
MRLYAATGESYYYTGHLFVLTSADWGGGGVTKTARGGGGGGRGEALHIHLQGR